MKIKVKIVLLILIFIILNGSDCNEKNNNIKELQNENIKTYLIRNGLFIIEANEKIERIWNLENFFQLYVDGIIIYITFLKGKTYWETELEFENEIKLNEFLEYFIKNFKSKYTKSKNE